MDLSERDITSCLTDALIGKRVHYFEALDSTNTCAAGLAQQGAEEGDVVIADCQTHGRGRMDRMWHSPPGKNLFTSIILQPLIDTSTASLLTLTAGVAVADVISRKCPERTRLKWPNDILIGGRKVCGILTEMKTKGNAIHYVIVGIGINVNMDMEEFPEELQQSATSLKEETGESLSRVEVAVSLYQCFETWYRVLVTEGFDTIRNRWMHYAGIMGREIEVKERKSTRRGRIVGLDDRGALVISSENGRDCRVISGDITVIGDEICC